ASLLSLHDTETGPEVGGDDRPREETRPHVPEGRDRRVGDRGLPAQASSREVEVRAFGKNKVGRAAGLVPAGINPAARSLVPNALSAGASLLPGRARGRVGPEI